jgi:hypothetical protein
MISTLTLISCRVILVLTTLLVIASSGCVLRNNPPVIDGLFADRNCLCVANNCGIHATATDPDGDELSYQWFVSDGSLYGEGASVTWQAPPIPGAYTITVKVTDGRGGEAIMTITLGVVPNSPPIIESLIAEQSGCMRADSVPVECLASDPNGDELSYKWTASGGEISGEGPAVLWIAPDETGKYIISVEVADGKGGEVSRQVAIYVGTG